MLRARVASPGAGPIPAGVASRARWGALLLALLCLSTACDSGASQTDRERAEELHVRGLEKMEAGANREALVDLRQAVDLWPEYVEGLATLGRAAERIGDFALSLDTETRLLALQPDRADSAARLVRSALGAGDPEATERGLAVLDRVQPKTGRTHLLHARAAFEAGDLEEAERHARRALRSTPGLTVALHILGVAHEERGEVDDAMRHYRLTLENDPGHLGARDRLATLLLRNGQDSQAERNRELHTRIRSATAGGFRFASPSDRHQSFYPLFEELPGWVLGCLELSRAQLELGRLPQAERTLKTGLEHNPQSPQLHEMMAAVLRQQGHFKRAERHSLLARGQAPPTAEAE